MGVEIRRLGPGDAEELYRVRRNALVAEPFAFLASPEDDRASSPQAVRESLSSEGGDTASFGAFDGERLVGILGLTRDRHLKAAHRACVTGVFVAESHRRRSVGTRLLNAAIDHARSLGLASVYLSVSEKTPGAKKLYESVGFVVWGLEPDCIRYEGESAREYHLSLAL